jgi:hypothetical protein
MVGFFPDHYADCEYNRHLQGMKKAGEKLIIPDIIVHDRQNDECSLLVVEVKVERDGSEVSEGEAEAAKADWTERQRSKVVRQPS